MREKFVTREGVIVDNSDVSIGEREETTWVWTEFWLSRDDFMIVKNSDGIFAFDLVERATGSDIDRVSFDLEDIVSDYSGQWMGSIENRPDNVQSATLYGDDIEDDGDMGDAFLNSSKNQIGPWINYNGQELKVRVGGDWFQVLKPGDYTREQYLKLYMNVLSAYTT
ncbi:hypothetical protein AMS69_15725 [Haloarcula rubripromontorii]|uniref:Uncharacterized protein n=1 Tax=Haloarcula rubripromontorii TaxID=1705562 RepID=A0A0N0BN54_9EURY|nr:hypothetical protein AMS69_15725 [Haloarcula rubripromontorii]